MGSIPKRYATPLRAFGQPEGDVAILARARISPGRPLTNEGFLGAEAQNPSSRELGTMRFVIRELWEPPKSSRVNFWARSFCKAPARRHAP